MKKACQYALLRFRPFIETGEFANVGVVLMAVDGSFFGFRLLEKNYSHITKFFHQLEPRIYQDGQGLFQEELKRFAQDWESVLTETSNNLPLARRMFAGLIQAREAMFHFGEARVVLCDDPPKQLDELFIYYVERRFFTGEYKKTSAAPSLEIA